MAIIAIKYDEITQESYKGIKISYGEHMEFNKLFNSGDFVKDWYFLNKFIIDNLLENEYHISYSSSVDHFLSCGNKYESVHLVHIKGNKWEFVKMKDLKPSQGGLEFFIENGSDITWEKMKKNIAMN